MRILICDDEDVIVEQLKKLISDNSPGNELVGIHSTQELNDLILSADADNFDVVFLDLVLDNEDGMDMGSYILKTFPKTKIVVVSGHPERLSETFLSIKPFGYISKPINPAILKRYLIAVERAITNEERYFTCTSNRQTVHLKFGDILYIESIRNKMLVHMANEIVEVSGKRMSQLEKELPREFVRCHNSFLINMENSAQHKKKFFKMINGEIIPISRAREEHSEIQYLMYKGGMI